MQSFSVDHLLGCESHDSYISSDWVLSDFQRVLGVFLDFELLVCLCLCEKFEGGIFVEGLSWLGVVVVVVFKIRYLFNKQL